LKAFIVENVVGVFGLDEKNRLIDSVCFPVNVKEIVEKIRHIREGELVKELKDLLVKLQERGYNIFIFESDAIAKTIQRKLNLETMTQRCNKTAKSLRKNLVTIAIESGFTENTEEVKTVLREVALSLGKIEVKEAMENRDLLAAQAVLTLTDLDNTLNLFSNRLREWYGLHFPELSNIVDDHELYLRIVSDLGDKKSLNKEKLSAIVPDSKVSKIYQLSESSMGAEFIETDINAVRLISKRCLELYNTRKEMEEYIDEIMSVVAPNIQALVDSTLGARLIAAAGSLKRLAAKPSSTIQILGAEKALFRSLKTKSKPPKHGFIFQHPQIRQAPWWQRGKISRALAGKLSIAARIDVYSGDYIGDKLKMEFEQRVKEIKEKYPKPSSKRSGG